MHTYDSVDTISSSCQTDEDSCFCTNPDAKCDRLHDKDSVWEDSSYFLHTGEILDRVPHISVFVQQLELPYRGTKAGQGEIMKED